MQLYSFTDTQGVKYYVNPRLDFVSTQHPARMFQKIACA